MQQYILVTKNTADVVNLLSGYANARNIYSDSARQIYVWTNSTNDDANALADLQERRMVLGLLLLPEAI